MYIEQDFVGPATLDLQANRKMHNRLLRYWPTKEVNGVIVMDKLYLYNYAVIDTPIHRKIYNILGLSVDKLKAENWKGVATYYMYFNIVQGTYDEVSNTDLTTYLGFQAPFTIKSIPTALENDRSAWFESEIGYEPLKVDSLSNALSDAEIITKVIANPAIVEYSIEEEHVLTALALLDTNEVIFERQFKILSRGLTEVKVTSQTTGTNAATFVKEVNILFKFRRKPQVDQLVYDAYLNVIKNMMYNSVNVPHGSLYTQLLSIYHSLVPFVDSEIIYNSYGIGFGEGINTIIKSYYRKDGLQAMKSREFNKTITARLKTDYTKIKQKTSWWKKLLTIVVVIIIVIVSIFYPPAFGLGQLAWSGLVLTVGSLAMMGLSVVLAKSDPAWAAYIGKMANVLGIAATIVGVVAIVQNIATKIGGEALKEAAKEALKDQAIDFATEEGKQLLKEQMQSMSLSYLGTAMKEITIDDMQSALVDFVKSAWSKSTSFNMQNMLNWATRGFQVYVKYINPPADGLDELSRKVKDQEEQLEDLSSAGLKDKIDYTFSSPFYNVYDFNEVMQAIPHRMTQGVVDDTFNKYYDGTTSKVKYRGYLG